MTVSIKAKDLSLTYSGDFRLELNDSGVSDIKEVLNQENELLMQQIVLRLASSKDDWAVSNGEILPIDFSAFIGLPLDESLVNAISNRIISSLVFQNLLNINEISLASVYYALNECYLAFNIAPQNNPNYRKALLLSYDSSTNILTPTVIDYIER